MPIQNSAAGDRIQELRAAGDLESEVEHEVWPAQFLLSGGVGVGGGGITEMPVGGLGGGGHALPCVEQAGSRILIPHWQCR